jgi:hypothetical protein
MIDLTSNDDENEDAATPQGGGGPSTETTLTQPICFVKVLNVSNIQPASEITKEAFYTRMQAVDCNFVTADMDLCHMKKLYSASQKR